MLMRFPRREKRAKKGMKRKKEASKATQAEAENFFMFVNSFSPSLLVLKATRRGSATKSS
jgi:hypothetical protein